MTNFEKWRDSLTPEKMADLLEISWDLCDLCPACESGIRGISCRENFTRWANSPAKEEE